MADAAVMRDRLFTMRMSEEEGQRLDSVAAHYGLNGASTIRMLIKREADALPTSGEKLWQAFLHRTEVMLKVSEVKAYLVPNQPKGEIQITDGSRGHVVRSIEEAREKLLKWRGSKLGKYLLDADGGHVPTKKRK